MSQKKSCNGVDTWESSGRDVRSREDGRWPTCCGSAAPVEHCRARGRSISIVENFVEKVHVPELIDREGHKVVDSRFASSTPHSVDIPLCVRACSACDNVARTHTPLKLVPCVSKTVPATITKECNPSRRQIWYIRGRTTLLVGPLVQILWDDQGSQQSIVGVGSMYLRFPRVDLCTNRIFPGSSPDPRNLGRVPHSVLRCGGILHPRCAPSHRVQQILSDQIRTVCEVDTHDVVSGGSQRRSRHSSVLFLGRVAGTQLKVQGTYRRYHRIRPTRHYLAHFLPSGPL